MVSKAVLFAPASTQESVGRGVQRPEPSEQVALLPVGNRPMVLHALDELEAAGVEHVAVVSETPVAAAVETALGERETGVGKLEHTAVDPNCAFLDRVRVVNSFLGDDQFAVHLCDSLRHGCLASSLERTPAGAHDVVALVAAPDPATTPVGAGLASVSSAGVYVFGRGIHDLPRADPPAMRLDVDIAHTVGRLEAAGGHLELRTVEHFWRYGHRPDVLLQANRFFLSALHPGPTEASVEGTELQGRVSIDSTARIIRSTVRGPVVVGPDVRISDAYIGPYTSVGRGVTIENAEVEHSILLEGASIRNLGARLEASVVGPEARIFRDFRLPRAFRLNVGEGAEVAIS